MPSQTSGPPTLFPVIGSRHHLIITCSYEHASNYISYESRVTSLLPAT